jgi:SAM-dependent methyltransferase
MVKTVWIMSLLVVLALTGYPAAKRSRWFLIANNIGQDTLRRWGISNTQIGQNATLHFPEAQIPAQIQRIASIYNQYLRYAGWTRESVAGKRILELGPGRHMGVPLRFAAAGADFVVGVDKFVSLQTGTDFVALYSRLRDTLSPGEQAAFDGAIQLQPRLALKRDRAGYVDHKELSDCVQDLGAGTFDMIASNAVMEEIYDPAPIYRAQDALLRPGGVMVHRIDLTDYGMFSKYGFHPLEFLTVSDWWYGRMVAGSGQPARRLIDYYRETGARLGYSTEIYVVRVLGSTADLPVPTRELHAGVDYGEKELRLVREIRPRLIERFRRMPDADLLPASMLFVGRKPGRSL